MSESIKEIPLIPLTIYGIMHTNMIPLSTYNITSEEDRQGIIEQILEEFATKDVVVLGGTLVYTEGFDGFRIL